MEAFKVFVYGTLLQGSQRSEVLKNSLYLRPAMIQAEMFDLGFFPGITEGDQMVFGEVYQVNSKMLNTLHHIEGYYELAPEKSLYLKKRVKAMILGNAEEAECFAYFYNRPVTENKRIEQGDYRRYLLEKEFKSQWIVAYGSNIDQKLLEKKVGRISDFRLGCLRGFDCWFNRKANSSDESYENIEYVGDDSLCAAVIYLLQREQIAILDKTDGVPDNYSRIAIPFEQSTGDILVAQAYVANPSRFIREDTSQQKLQDYIQVGKHQYDLPLENNRAGKNINLN